MPSAGAVPQLLSFSLGPDVYAVPVDRVREVVPHAVPRYVPTPAPWLLGVLSVRGMLVPVCDLAVRLASPHPPAEKRPSVVIAAGDGGIGLLVDDVGGLVATGELQELPVGDDPLLAGIAEADGTLVLVLALDRLVEEVAALRPKPKRKSVSPSGRRNRRPSGDVTAAGEER